MFKHFQWVVITALVILGVGCGGKHLPETTALEIQKSYESAEEPVKQQVVRVKEALNRQDYAQAVIAMNEVIRSQAVIDEAQKKAVDNLVRQTRQAVEQNPSLNSPEVYKATAELFFRVHPEN